MKGRVFFIQHKMARTSRRRDKATGKQTFEVLEPSEKKMTSNLFRKWVKEYFLEDPRVQTNDILLLDNDKPHHDPVGQKMLKEASIDVRFLPPYAAKYLSILDNCVFRFLRADFATACQDTPPQNVDEKEKIIQRVWRDYPPECITSSWKKCGYLVRHKQIPSKATVFRRTRGKKREREQQRRDGGAASICMYLLC